MRILVTNDDGINSEGLKLLAKTAKKYGDVIVIAPLKEQSAKSQALNIKHGFSYQRINHFLEDIEAYAVDSTPADCVRFATYFLRDEFTLVLSGVNNGFNLGEDILYSGTVGAASEGVMSGKKAIALSTKPHDFSGAERDLEKVLDYVIEKLLPQGDFFNVNIPVLAVGIKLTKQGSTHFSTVFLEEGREVFQRGKPNFHLDEETQDSDVYAIYENYISITPLSVDRTDYRVFDTIKKSNN
ncbi:MAG: 5'/3'-nucleotidase SurE [Bacilli bacterium]|nr:5'/3'-nucleotidase SurE [Bacilli bacterium]